jgi:hypothetical protein
MVISYGTSQEQSRALEDKLLYSSFISKYSKIVIEDIDIKGYESIVVTIIPPNSSSQYTLKDNYTTLSNVGEDKSYKDNIVIINPQVK